MALSYPNIGLSGNAVGACSLKDDLIEWKDRNSVVTEFKKGDLKSLNWAVFGSKAYLKMYMKDGSWSSMDGFSRDDFNDLANFIKDNYEMNLEKDNMSSEGMSFGDIVLKEKTILMKSVSDKKMFEMKLDNAAQAVIPQANKDDLEIQFMENDADKEEDGLVQCTFHFPPAEEDEEGNVDENTPAQLFQAEILNTGVIKTVKGNVICEFSKDLGNFVSPRGKYSMQMTSTYLHMQGAQYSYKIKYNDITSLFLLDKPDGLRMAFVICLDKPIRQGTQRYQHLVLETHKMEHTIALNLTEGEIDANESYKGNLQPEMTMATASLIAKIFKVLTETTVFVPSKFHSFRGDFAVRCNYKTTEGFIYPLAKSLIFINKPTIIVKYEEVDYVEFQRYAPVANSATRNFDCLVVLRKGHSHGADTQFLFSSIDRQEYTGISDFFEAKKIKVLNPQKAEMDQKGKVAGAFAGMDGDGDDDEDSEEDDDYQAGGSDHSADSDDSGSDNEGGEGGDDGEGDDEDKPKKEKKRKPAAEKRSKSSPTKKQKGEKKKKEKKVVDPNAPKKPQTAFFVFIAEFRVQLKEEGSTMKPAEVAKVAGEKWKALTAEEKEPYNAKATADKERYAAAMKEYEAKRTAAGADLDGGEDDIDMDMDVDMGL